MFDSNINNMIIVKTCAALGDGIVSVPGWSGVDASEDGDPADTCDVILSDCLGNAHSDPAIVNEATAGKRECSTLMHRQIYTRMYTHAQAHAEAHAPHAHKKDMCTDELRPVLALERLAKPGAD